MVYIILFYLKKYLNYLECMLMRKEFEYLRDLGIKKLKTIELARFSIIKMSMSNNIDNSKRPHWVLNI